MIVITHSGKIGDFFKLFPLCEKIYEYEQKKICFIVPEKMKELGFEGLFPLIKFQPFCSDVIFSKEWLLLDFNFGGRPSVPLINEIIKNKRIKDLYYGDNTWFNYGIRPNFDYKKETLVEHYFRIYDLKKYYKDIELNESYRLCLPDDLTLISEYQNFDLFSDIFKDKKIDLFRSIKKNQNYIFFKPELDIFENISILKSVKERHLYFSFLTILSEYLGLEYNLYLDTKPYSDRIKKTDIQLISAYNDLKMIKNQ